MSPVEYERLPFTERPDLTPYLIHLTRKSEDGSSARDNLTKILKTGRILGSSTQKGFIKGPRKAACFMDVPFIALKYICNRTNKLRYEPCGIFVTKKFAYQQGARPVLYLSNKEIKDLKIPNDQLWRVVRFEVKEAKWISWIHEREWRCPDYFELPNIPIGVLLKSAKDAIQLQKTLLAHRKDFRSFPRSIIPLNVICQGLNYL